jgi:ATP-dependent Lon protease
VTNETQIPLFPLGVVLMPGQRLPLHIFEERYKLMINQCLDEDKEFGVVFYDGGQLYSVGCTASIAKVTKFYDDGRMDISTLGQKRFIIKELVEVKPYAEGSVTFFEDETEALTEETKSKAEQGLTYMKEYFGFDDGDENTEKTSLTYYQNISFLIAGADGFSWEEKQKFLEMTSTGERIEKSLQSLVKMVERIQLSAEISKIIGGNGRFPSALRNRFKSEVKSEKKGVDHG